MSRHTDLLPRTFGRYIEPFLGSGAVFFYLKPTRAVLGDTNAELITTYQGVKNSWEEVERLLRSHKSRHSDSYYYSVRNTEPRNAAARAARLIYLNRTCFNGIYRVNRRGKFNVPKGTRDSVIFDTDNFAEVARSLKNAEIIHADFESLINTACEGDLIFADPPYTVRHNLNGFIKYNETLFSWEDQVRLADALGRARDRGAKIVATNANHESVRELYRRGRFILRDLSRFSSISGDSSSRKQFEELAILSEDFTQINGDERTTTQPQRLS